MNHEKLEGKVIDYNTRIKTVGVIKGKVVLADPAIGLTVVSEDDPEHYLLCLICKGSPKWCGDAADDTVSQKLFKLICTYIDEGVVDNRKLHNFFLAAESTYRSDPSVDTCAFA